MNSNFAKSLTEEFFSSSNENTLSNNPENLIKILNNFCSALNLERHKKDIFLNLSDRGLNRLLSLLKSQNEEIRKKSFKVLVMLLNKSEILQNIFCEKFNFNPIGNIIVMNWLPLELKNKLKFNEHVLYEIKKTQNDNLNNTKLFWHWPPNDKYNNDNFPDPQKYLLGIYCVNQNQIKIEEKTFNDDFNIDDLVNELEK